MTKPAQISAALMCVALLSGHVACGRTGIGTSSEVPASVDASVTTDSDEVALDEDTWTDAAADCASQARNLCGGCEQLDEVPGAPCGLCGEGRWECDGLNNVLCPTPATHCAARQVSTHYRTCALLIDGSVWCWGRSLVEPSGTDVVPRRVDGLGPATEVVADTSRVCVVLDAHTVQCVIDASSTSFPRGDGTDVWSAAPVSIRFDDAIVDLAMDYPTAVTTESGQVYYWGFINGTPHQVLEPTLQTNLPPGWTVTPDYIESCATTHEGEIYTLGFGDTNRLPRRLPFEGNAHSAECGRDHFLALDKDGTVWGWGDNTRGRLGFGHTSFVDVPTQLDLPTNVVGWPSSRGRAVLGEDGRVYTWGANAFGTRGDGSADRGLTPHLVAAVPDLDQVIAFDASPANICAVRDDQSVWCWGDNADGAVGDGTQEDRRVPTRVRWDLIE